MTSRSSDFPEQILEGWGRYPRSRGFLGAVQSGFEAAGVLRRRKGLRLLGRGAGRAYGDAALSAGQLVLDCTPMDRLLAFDPASGRVRAEAGVTLETLLKVFVPRGFFLPVTPGTKYPTLGGSLACDVHGKSSHPLSHYVERLEILLSDGSTAVCSRSERPDLFWATLGGMGLTGLIASAELTLQPIESSWIRYQGLRAKNLEAVFSQLEESGEWPLTVAWINGLGRGRNLGQGIVMRGAFARRNELPAPQLARVLQVPQKPKVTVPFDFPAFSLNPLTVAAFNAWYYGRHPEKLDTIMDYDSFFYPLDSVLHWNRVYGKPGLVQYQFLLPLETGLEGMKALLEVISASGRASFLAVLKKFGRIENPGMLSFPRPGYFLALDFPVAGGSIFKEMDQWDQLVLKYGGRIYLAKDARMKAGTFRQMYPRLEEWKSVKAKVDPGQVWGSDLGKRLGLSL